MPINRKWGIKPGAGKGANEFDELDAEDARIEAELEAKAQAGIPVGADHPLVASHRHDAVKVGKAKARVEVLFGDAKAEAQRRIDANGGIDPLDELKAEGEAAKWPGMGFAIDTAELKWFMGAYRLKPSAREEDDECPLEALRKIDYAEQASRELQAVYHASPGLRRLSELERRKGLASHFAAYHAAVRGPKRRAPKSVVVTDYLPLLRKLTNAELVQLDEEEQLARICSHHTNFSAPFKEMRNFLVFWVFFLVVVFAGRDRDPFLVRDALTGAFNSDKGGFEAVVSSMPKLHSYLQGPFLSGTYPTLDPGGANTTLGCRAQQYLADGVNVRLGPVSVRQVRVGAANALSRPWRAADAEDGTDSTCSVPAIFQDALEARCFRTWGGHGGASGHDEATRRYRGRKWQSGVELDLPGWYSVHTRLQWPGSGYAKRLANNAELARADLEALEAETWLDLQTRAVFIELSLLNLPTGLISFVRFSAEFGAEGLVTPGLHVDTARTYRFRQAALYTWAAASEPLPWLAAVAAAGGGLVGTLLLGTRVFKVKRRRDRTRLLGAAGAAAVFGAWAALAGAGALLHGRSVAHATEAPLWAATYLAAAGQAAQLRRAVSAAVASGDAWQRFVLGDVFQLMHLLNLAAFGVTFGLQVAALAALERRIPALGAAIHEPCSGLSDGGGAAALTAAELAAWNAVPTGCYGSLEYSGATPYVDYGACPSGDAGRMAADCCTEAAGATLAWVVHLEAWVVHLTALNALFLSLRALKFLVPLYPTALYVNTLGDATKAVGSVGGIMALVMVAFSVAFHLAFGFATESFRDFPESIKTLLEVLLGTFDFGALRLINPYLGPAFFLCFVVVVVMVILSMLVAVVNSSYEQTREELAEPEFAFIRKELWTFVVEDDGFQPLPSPLELYERMGLSKRFRRDPQAYALSKSDREKITATVETLLVFSSGEATDPDAPAGGGGSGEDEESKSGLPGEDGGIGGVGSGDLGGKDEDDDEEDGGGGGGGRFVAPDYFRFRRQDGKAVLGNTTDLLVGNTTLFRRALQHAAGIESRHVVEDLSHAYWAFLQIPPLPWLTATERWPGVVFRALFPSVPHFKAWLDGGDVDFAALAEAEKEEAAAAAAANGGDGNEEEEDDEAGGEDVSDDVYLRSIGVTQHQIDTLHKFQEPKLSFMRDLASAEDGQAAVLAAMERVGRKASELGNKVERLETRRRIFREKEAKRAREAEAEARAHTTERLNLLKG